MTRRLYLLLTALMLTALTPLRAQLRWIADSPLPGTSSGSLYQMLADNQPVVLAVGTLGSESAQQMLDGGALQDLAANHGTGTEAAPYSMRDLHVAFVNVRVFSGTEPKPHGLPVVSVDEEDPLLSKPGWNGLYEMAATRLFLVTPDRLVRPIKNGSAAEIYAQVQAWSSKLKPGTSPDLRLLDAAMEGNEAHVRVQNFSTGVIHHVQLFVIKDGQKIAQARYDQEIPSLEDALIPVPLPQGYNTRLTIIAKADAKPTAIKAAHTVLFFSFL